MEFALLIYGNEKLWTEATAEQKQQTYAQHERFMKMLQDRGAIRGGAELDATTTARTIRHGGDDLGVTAGPLAQTAEQLGGCGLIEAADIEEAVAIGKELPAAVVEVRPLV